PAARFDLHGSADGGSRIEKGIARDAHPDAGLPAFLRIFHRAQVGESDRGFASGIERYRFLLSGRKRVFPQRGLGAKCRASTQTGQHPGGKTESVHALSSWSCVMRYEARFTDHDSLIQSSPV